MDYSEILPLVSRWLHILTAITLIGGTVFLRWSVVPVQGNTDGWDALFESMRSRWSKLVMLSVLFLLVSGLYNAAQKAIGYDLDKTYLTLLVLKIGLAFVIFFLVSVLSGRSQLAQKFRAAGAKWYNLTIFAMVLIVCIAGFMKMSPQPIKVKQSEAAARVVANDLEPGGK